METKKESSTSLYVAAWGLLSGQPYPNSFNNQYYYSNARHTVEEFSDNSLSMSKGGTSSIPTPNESMYVLTPVLYIYRTAVLFRERERERERALAMINRAIYYIYICCMDGLYKSMF